MVVANDTFTRANSASSLGSTEEGRLAWSVSAGTTWGVSSGKAYCPTLGGGTIWPGPGGHAFVDIGSADMVVEVLITGTPPTASTCFGVVARYQDNVNFWTAFIQNGAGTPKLYCGPVVAGSVTYSVASGVVLSGSGPWLLKLVAKGDAVTVFVDGVVQGTVASSALDTQTKAGLMVGNAGATQALFENWGAMPYPASDGSALAQQIMLDSPVGYWPLDEASGSTANDRSGNGRNGTPTVGVTPHPGHAGMRAYDFDGGSGHNVSIAHNAALNLTTDLTVEWWFYLDTFVSNAGMGKSLAWRFDHGTDGIYFYLEQNSGSFWRYARLGMASYTGAVHHVVASFDSVANTFAFVLDGVVTAPVATGGPTGTRGTSDTSALLLGQYPLFGTIDGRMWDVALYNTVLSAARAKVHYQAGLRSGVSIG